MAGAGTGEMLFEREVELAAFADALDCALAGSGSVLLISGPAGIGKTRIVSACCERASAGGASVFSARGGELETAFPYGVVRQLFEAPLNAASA